MTRERITTARWHDDEDQEMRYRDDSLGAIVLAAGASTRMGRPKALLPIGSAGETFVSRVVRTLGSAGLSPIVVVVRAELQQEISRVVPGAALAVNTDPSRGQLSSLLAGFRALGDPAAVLMTLVDLPLVRVDTVTTIVEAWRRTGAPLVRPVHDGRHGHPVIFAGPLLAALSAADLAAGAKPITRAFAEAAVDIAVDDEGVLRDFDTPDDYQTLLGP